MKCKMGLMSGHARRTRKNGCGVRAKASGLKIKKGAKAVGLAGECEWCYGYKDGRVGILPR